MFRIHRWTMVVGALLMLFGVLPVARPAHAQDKVCFPQTNQCVEGRFLEYWRQNGGLSVFGYPVGPAREELNRDTGKTYLTQWFERNRFELHPENARPYDVLLGLLGQDHLLRQGRTWQQFPTASSSAAHYFPNTSHAITHEPFWRYWSTHGLEFDGRAGVSYAESLALFGYPVSEPAMETNSSGDRVLTQWFERARFEFHPNNPEPYTVLLGLLGNDLKPGSGSTTPPTQGAHPPVSYAATDGGVYEIRGQGQVAQIGAAPFLGRVIDAVRTGDQVFMLREQGLQKLTVGGQATTIATFTKGNARFGNLIAPAGTTRILYSYGRTDDSAPMGSTGIVGVIENGSAARKIVEAPNQMSVLGLSRDERAVYIVDWGGDPGIGQVRVVALATGRDLASLPYRGYAAVALAPSRAMVAMGDLQEAHTANVMVYDVNNQTSNPVNVRVPRPSWNVTQLAWAPDSRVVYALAYPISDRPLGELWRVDPVARKAELVASSVPTDMRLHNVASDGRTLLGQTVDSAVVMNLETGRILSYPLPRDAVIAHAR